MLLRQILKLKQAQRAFREGRIDEALGLAEDPEIRDHAKAERLRERCLSALESQARREVDAGELSLAARRLDEVAQRGDREAAALRKDEVLAMKRERDDAAGRARARYFQARLEADRGDLLAAIAVLEEIEEGHRGDEVRALAAELDRRRSEAARLVAEARASLRKKPADAEELLVKAARLDGHAEGLLDSFLELARTRARLVVDDRVSDGALASFLLEHGLFKRRHLGGLPASQHQSLDADLNAAVKRRAAEHVSAGRLEAAARLLERRRENLVADADLDANELALRGLLACPSLVERGLFEEAQRALDEAGRRLGRSRELAEAKKNLASVRKAVAPALEAADLAVREGDAASAKERVLDALERAPRHEGARALLRAINATLEEHRRHLGEARRLIDRGKLEEAEDALLALKSGSCRDRDVELMLREVSMLLRTRSERAPRTSLAGTPALRPVGSAGEESRGASWLLGVEEHGEFLVLEADRVTFGSESGGAADVRLMAGLGGVHAAVSRRTSFHGGCRYRVEALNGHEVRVDGRRVEAADLEDGAVLRLGREVEFTFRRPSARSGAARIEVRAPHEIEGVQGLILMPPGGRAGSVIVGDRDDAHVRTQGKAGEVEILRDREGRLTARSPTGIARDGEAARPQVEAPAGARLVGDEVAVTVGVRS